MRVAVNAQGNIELFEDWFSRQLIAIRDLSSDNSGYLFRHVLYFCFLDTLRHAYEKSVNGNKIRFISFIEKFCDWPDGDRISLPVLIEYFRERSPAELGDLFSYANQEVTKWSRGTVIRLDSDPRIGDVQSLWPSSLKVEGSGKKNSLDDFKHLNLLWDFRNFAVHEMSIPTGSDHIHELTPYYAFIHDSVFESREYWGLFQPLKFLDKLCEQATQNLVKHFKSNSIDPYANYKVNGWSN